MCQPRKTDLLCQIAKRHSIQKVATNCSKDFKTSATTLLGWLYRAHGLVCDRLSNFLMLLHFIYWGFYMRCSNATVILHCFFHGSKSLAVHDNIVGFDNIVSWCKTPH